MTPIEVPRLEEVQRRIHAGEASSLMTPVGVIEGEALAFLEERGATTLRELIRELEWPARMVTMAVGALVREGLVRAMQHELEVVIEPVRTAPRRSWREADPVPEVWGGEERLR